MGLKYIQNYFKTGSPAKGLTLVEVIVAVGLMAGIVISIVAVFLYSLRSNAIIWEQLKTQNEGRSVMQIFSKEVRIATISSLGAYPLEEASSTQIIFYADIDSDSYREKVRYFLSGATLQKGVIKPTGSPLVYDVGNEIITDLVHDISTTSLPIFTYYDENYTGIEDALTQPVDVTEVRTAGISLKLEQDPYASPAPFHIETKVQIRNLKDN